jgi:hypothetical protein
MYLGSARLEANGRHCLSVLPDVLTCSVKVPLRAQPIGPGIDSGRSEPKPQREGYFRFLGEQFLLGVAFGDGFPEATGTDPRVVLQFLSQEETPRPKQLQSLQ